MAGPTPSLYPCLATAPSTEDPARHQCVGDRGHIGQHVAVLPAEEPLVSFDAWSPRPVISEAPFPELVAW